MIYGKLPVVFLMALASEKATPQTAILPRIS